MLQSILYQFQSVNHRGKEGGGAGCYSQSYINSSQRVTGERKGVGLVVTVNLISIPVSESQGKGRGGAGCYSQSYINSSQ